MSKFSVGQRVRMPDDYYEEKVAGTSGIVVERRGDACIVRVDGDFYAPCTLSGCGREEGWYVSGADTRLTLLHRFSVNDKVTIKNVKGVGIVRRIFEMDGKYEVTVQYDENHAWIYIVSDDDLDPYVEPPIPDDNDAIKASILADIDARFDKGRETYGHGVRVDDPYDWLTMIDEELLDALIYVRAEKLRRSRSVLRTSAQRQGGDA